jgi:hypothetical protein
MSTMAFLGDTGSGACFSSIEHYLGLLGFLATPETFPSSSDGDGAVLELVPSVVEISLIWTPLEADFSTHLLSTSILTPHTKIFIMLLNDYAKTSV